MLTPWQSTGLRDLDQVFAALEELRRDVDRIWGGLEPRTREVTRDGRDMVTVPVNLYDQGDSLVLRMHVPGFERHRIQVSAEPRAVHVRASRKLEIPEGYSIHQQQRDDRELVRSLALPCQIDSDRVKARVRDGVLEVRLPKLDEHVPRSIEVDVD